VLEGLDLVEVAATLAVCQSYLGNDSGISHLAAAVGTPVTALFGPTDPAVWRPLGPAVRVVRATAGSELRSIRVETVLHAVRCAGASVSGVTRA
jgi:heptosyltransferase III